MECNGQSPNESDYLDNIMSINESQSSIYYAVHVPTDKIDDNDQVFQYIFFDKSEAINLIKKHKKARFKSFMSYKDAENFVIHGKEDTSLIPSENAPVAEKSIQFKMPKSQDLVKFRKNIENGFVQLVHDTIWENPRYLIGNGDTPTILQEGFRYNALHIAARTKNWKMADLVLNIISDVSFIQFMYGEDCFENAEERSKVLLDLYLNTPDKGLNETPLHFATKFGAVEVVEVLVSFAECDRTVKNKYGKSPAEVICERCNENNLKITKNKIATLLEDNFYVPLIRSENNCTIPVIGEPFSPKSPLNYNNNPLQPRLEIHAYAGPLKKEEAERFRRIWKTPPRSLKSNKSKYEFSRASKSLELEKGSESIGRELAAKYDIGWKEYWPFLGIFVDLASLEGLQQLEKFLQKRTFSNLDIDSSPFCEKLNQIITLNGSPQINSYLFLEKSCQVFANRISNEILIFKDANSNEIYLETSISQLQNSIENFSKDNRFEDINIGRIHKRIGYLIALNLIKSLQPHEKKLFVSKLKQWLINCDELVKDKQYCSSTNQQIICLLKYILNSFENELNDRKSKTEENYIEALSNGELCSCEWQYQHKIGRFDRNAQYIVRRLDFENIEADVSVVKSTLTLNTVKDCDFESDDEYYTPSSSPLPTDESSEDEFEEASNPREDVFIEESVPTSTDIAVFNSLKRIEKQLNPIDYPYTYKWHHAMRIYLGQNEIIQNSSPTYEKLNATYHSSPILSTPPEYWTRITGINSPRNTLSRSYNNKCKINDVRDKYSLF